MSEENKALARKFFRMFASGDAEMAEEIVAADYTNHDAPDPNVGSVGVKAGVTSFKKAFPDAQVKFFLSASAAERGRRRYEELLAKGLDVDLQQTIQEVEERDAADSAREHAPLKRAADAIDIDSTQLSIDEVLARMMVVITERQQQAEG